MTKNIEFDGFCLLSIKPYQIFDNWLLVGSLLLVPTTFMDLDRFILLVISLNIWTCVASLLLFKG
jgi:hypothetical protein